MPTASALLLHARDPDAEGRRELVEAAEALVRDGVELCQLAATWAQLEEPAAAARALERAMEHAGDVRVARSIARLYRTALGDPDAAARALAACDAALMRRSPSADDWRLLAAGWSDAGDRDAALHYLAHAAAAAATADEQCAVALAYADAGDRAAARSAIERAAGGAESVLAWAVIAWAYGALGDPEAMHASLAAGRERIESADDATLMAAAYASSGGTGSDIDECLARGEALVATDDDRSFIAAVACEHGRRPSGPSGPAATPPPSAPRAPAAILRRRGHSLGWPHGPNRLLDRLRPRIGDDRPRKMAALLHDRRYMSPTWLARLPDNVRQMVEIESERAAEATIAALRDIAATGLVPLPLDAGPLRMVITQTRLAEETGLYEDAASGIDKLARAFVYTLACIDGAAGHRQDGGLDFIAPLLGNCIMLGTEEVADLVPLLAAMADAYGDGVSRMVAELGLVLAAAWLDPADPRLAAAVARLISDERRHRSELLLVHGDAWLLGLTEDARTTSFEWSALARAILAPPIADLPHLARLAALLDY